MSVDQGFLSFTVLTVQFGGVRSLEPMLHDKRSHCNEKSGHRKEEQPLLAATRESPCKAAKTQRPGLGTEHLPGALCSGTGSPALGLHFSCLHLLHAVNNAVVNMAVQISMENPRDGGAWWAAIYGVAQSQTQLK